MKIPLILGGLTLAVTVAAGTGPSIEEARKTSPWIVVKAGKKAQDGLRCPNPKKDYCRLDDVPKDEFRLYTDPDHDMQVACRHQTARDKYVSILLQRRKTLN
jgi:hypothetical protein